VKLKDLEIGICQLSDIPALQEFIHRFVREEHILSISRDLLCWLHENPSEKQLNFFIAKRPDSKEIMGIVGFTPLEHFDPELRPLKVIYTSLWFIDLDCKIPGLGLQLFSHMLKHLRADAYIGLAMTDEALAMHKLLGFKIGYMNHFYMVNQQKRGFHLIDRFDGNYVSDEEEISNQTLIERISEDRFLEETRSLQKWDGIYPEKTPTYFYNRYKEHPIYSYHLYAISAKEDIQAVFVIRKASAEGAHALRLVDYIGNPEALIGTKESFQEILTQQDAEYIDFYNHGFEDTVFARAGFLEQNESRKVVIPDHFEPFEKRNVKISYAYKVARDRSDLEDRLVLFKGDGDQDRPSTLP
jgi:hypothetical protein